MNNPLKPLFVTIIVIISVAPAFSATWDGGGSDNYASNSENWASDSLPQYGDTINFDGASSKDCQWDLNGIYAGLIISGGYGGSLIINSTALTISGSEQSLTAPSATTNPVTNNASGSATLNATVNPNGGETIVFFEWGTTDSYGNTTAIQTLPAVKSGFDVSANISGLPANTLYHYRVRAANSAGATYGSDVSFTTSAIAPTVITNAASNNTGKTATLNATVNPNGAETIVYFEWGDTTAYGNMTAQQVIPAGVDNIAVNAALSALSVRSTYHYRAVAVNSAGTTYGEDMTFDTCSHLAPTAETKPATNKNGDSATLNATINPNGLETNMFFQWGTDTSYGNTTPAQTIPAGVNDIAIFADISGLSNNTTYHYRVVATNADGTTYGEDVSFTTPSITINIISPVNGSFISRPDVVVAGEIISGGQEEIGVTVNGIVGTVYGNQFVVNGAPLTSGVNIITVTANDALGNKATKSIRVIAETGGSYIRLIANTETGIAPLEVTLRLSGTFSIKESVLYYSGPALPEVISNVADEYKLRINTEGVYAFMAQTTGPDGNVYEAWAVVTVLNRAQQDASLRAKWEGMKTALRNKDIEGALAYFASQVKDRYRQKFEANKDRVASLIDTFEKFEIADIVGNRIQYRIYVRKDGNLYRYNGNFIQDENGLWKFRDF